MSGFGARDEDEDEAYKYSIGDNEQILDHGMQDGVDVLVPLRH